MKNEVNSVKSTRNYGIDMLRLAAMFLVVILHMLSQSGALTNTTGPQYAVSWFLEIAAYCAANCFAMVSGYVCYHEDENAYHYGKYLQFWAPVFVYSFGITVCVYIMNPSAVGIMELIKSALPVTTAKYWYVNAYTGLFFLIPWINKLIRKMTRQELNQLVLILFAVFSLFYTFAGLLSDPLNFVSDPFKLAGGYSVIWLALLYIVGAWIKKNDVGKKWKTSSWVILIAACILFTWLWKVFSPIASSLFVSYVSFTIVIVAVGLVVIFSRFRFNSTVNSMIRVFSPAAFGVYLIHVQPFVWRYFMTDTFSWIADSPAWSIPFEVLGCAFGIFVVCLMIERIRQFIFHILKINRLIQILQEWFDSKINTLFCKICK